MVRRFSRSNIAPIVSPLSLSLTHILDILTSNLGKDNVSYKIGIQTRVRQGGSINTNKFKDVILNINEQRRGERPIRGNLGSNKIVAINLARGERDAVMSFLVSSRSLNVN